MRFKHTQHTTPLFLSGTRLRILLLATGWLLPPGLAQTAPLLTQPLPPQMATVFLRGAELFSTGSIALPAGESEVLFTGVAGNINEQSLRLNADKGVTIQSYAIANDFLSEEHRSPEVEALQHAIEALHKDRDALNIQLSIIQEQLAILTENRRLGHEKTGASTAEITRLLDLVDKRMRSALTIQAQTRVQLKKLEEKLEKLEQQLKEEQAKQQTPGGQILVKFFTPKAATPRITLSYTTPNAGWVPSYDLRVDTPEAPVTLTHKARIFQNTGVNWKAITLELSTGNPTQGAQSPQLRPWYIDLDDPHSKPYAASAPRMMAAPAPMHAAADSVSPPAKLKREGAQTLEGYVSTDSQGINTTFQIELPYTIPTDGKGHVVLIQNTQLPGSYYHTATPKLDPDVFLEVEVQDWQKLNLLPGQTSIFFENSFVGQGYIRPQEGLEPLRFSLGRDKQVLVTRETDARQTSSPTFFGNTIQKEFAYTFKARNTRTKPIELRIFDQIPVSQNQDLTLRNLETGTAELDKKSGKLRWTLKLAPQESRSFPFSYTVAYPKDKTVNGLGR